MPDEIWKEISNYGNPYRISNTGKIQVAYGRIERVKSYIDKITSYDENGFEYVLFYPAGKRKKEKGICSQTCSNLFRR